MGWLEFHNYSESAVDCELVNYIEVLNHLYHLLIINAFTLQNSSKEILPS